MSAALRLATPAPSTDPTPADRELIDRKEKARLLSVSVATLDRMVAAGKTPRPLRLSHGCIRWRLSTVRAWLAASEAAGRLLSRDEFERLR